MDCISNKAIPAVSIRQKFTNNLRCRINSFFVGFDNGFCNAPGLLSNYFNDQF